MNQLDKIERYYDAAPRSAARVERIGPFEVFVNVGAAWPYYARPALGAAEFSAQDVQRVRERQRELGIPESFEWLAETTPALAAAAEAGGVRVRHYPLLVLGQLEEHHPVEGVELRLVTPEDDLARINAVAAVAFGGQPREPDPASLEFQRDRLRRGLTVSAVALIDGEPVATGSHQSVQDVSELVGIATLPSYQRRGFGTALTAFLAADALRRGSQTVFLSAGDDATARVYERVGFERVATACIAEA
jgi:ribosomal protein S18 acetylase RimI-like enzyme